jgi:Holliday junction resolvase RusA-like endonuclease
MMQGKLLCHFRVPGRAISWAVPDIGKDANGKRWALKDQRLCRWQQTVQGYARKAWGCGEKAYTGPVGLSLWFYLRENGATPDITNLEKAFEDALQGVIIGNDRAVCAKHAERYFIPRGEEERTWVQVWALPNGGRVEPVDPGPYSYRPQDWVGLQTRSA